MSKRKPIDKQQVRQRRDRLLESAAAAELSLTDGVREMRAIAGMTQEEFARHRGVSARVIKALELGQGNPTVATLNRIGEFFGLEVAFVPVKRPRAEPDSPTPTVTEQHLMKNMAAMLDTLNQQLGRFNASMERAELVLERADGTIALAQTKTFQPRRPDDAAPPSDTQEESDASGSPGMRAASSRRRNTKKTGKT